jgi:ATP-dependent Clp protease ATP-binding subunit ClpA
LIFGLTQDKSGITHHLFVDVNNDPEMLSGYVAKLGREPAGEEGEPFHAHLFTVFERAREVKKALGDTVVTSEHLLIALMSIKGGSCYETLREFAVDPDDIRIECLEALGFEDEECPRWG